MIQFQNRVFDIWDSNSVLLILICHQFQGIWALLKISENLFLQWTLCLNEHV
jgi:hypothetical protein